MNRRDRGGRYPNRDGQERRLPASRGPIQNVGRGIQSNKRKMQPAKIATTPPRKCGASAKVHVCVAANGSYQLVLPNMRFRAYLVNAGTLHQE